MEIEDRDIFAMIFNGADICTSIVVKQILDLQEKMPGMIDIGEPRGCEGTKPYFRAGLTEKGRELLIAENIWGFWC